jgi:hypothetical protein
LWPIALERYADTRNGSRGRIYIMTPMLQDRVRLGSSNEVFLVVGIDYSRRKVDVVPTSREFMIVHDLPFESLMPVWRAHAAPAAA